MIIPASMPQVRVSRLSRRFLIQLISVSTTATRELRGGSSSAAGDNVKGKMGLGWIRGFRGLYEVALVDGQYDFLD